MKRTKRTSRPKKKIKKKQVKTAAAQKKSKKKVSSALPRILAVAIGDPANSRTIDSIPALALPYQCRYYISGMVDQLMRQSTQRLLGTDYVIDYQECYEGAENLTLKANTALVLCMSTPVMNAAVAANVQVPIVGVTSTPGNFEGDVCGVNAQRTANPIKYYNHFQNDLGAGATITLLNRTGNPVSEACKTAILQQGNPVPGVAEVAFPIGTDPQQSIIAAINNIKPVNAGDGLLVLPVDVFFGFAHKINTTAESRGMKVFWPAEEFARHHHSHYGSSQVVCGQNFGKQADYILTNHVAPKSGLQWIKVDPR
jgi:hypothetical protein